MSGPDNGGETQFLAVTNNLKHKLVAKFHGEVYEWKPRETVNISLEAAQHIFDFGKDDKTTAFLRIGFINANQPDLKVAYAMLDQIDFVPLLQVLTSDTKRRGKVNVGDRGSRPDAGESSGEADSASPAAPDAVVGGE